jgi:primosomal protein N' (replication factor Y)
MKATNEVDLFSDAVQQGQTVPLYADIVFDRPLDFAYTYSIPEQLRQSIAVGKRVLAPFGRGDKPTIGYCTRVTPNKPDREVKKIQLILDDEPLLTPTLLRLTRWMADYYLCGWGQVLNAALPAGVRHKAGMRNVSFVEAIPETELATEVPALTEKQSLALQELRSARKPLEPRYLARLAGCGLGPIDWLVTKGLARRFSKRIALSDRETEPLEDESPIALNADQLNAWAPIELALRQGGFRAFVLHGVTGSGKTEIYLQAIDEALRQGKQAIVMVPEISLTPQTIRRFRSRSGEVAVLHSNLGDAERAGHWRRVAAGQVQVVVGARSAVFAPARKLGLIVIDEEHEGTFKQDSTPRYHGRDVAVMRSQLEGVPIILGSATPSLETWHNAERGHYRLLSLPNRVLDRPLPQVHLIDLRRERPARSGFHVLSPSMEAAIRDALAGEGQVMLLLNRRGFSTHVHCPSCGHVELCRFCDLALTHHRVRRILLCHHCGYEQAPPDICPGCGKAEIRYQGFGTEKLQAEVEQKFPGAVVRRMDSDSMRGPGSHERVLTAFRHRLINILLGTQMIAKGLDFPNVTLVGVVNADVGLHVPDFRSAERTFQLLSQVAGRAGRGVHGGKVLVQTYNPEQPCIALAAKHEYAGFVSGEMEHRRAHNYPPYERLARLIIRSREADTALRFAERLADTFQHAMHDLASRSPQAAVRLLGPAEAPVHRLKGYYRYHFQLQSASASALHDLLSSVLGSIRTPSGVEFTVDVDPLNML